ncbi:MAG: sensor domain-containing diguanylate cyclase [Candidatus Omnitrophica bacterium]|nr:sensor domain-containing diguanylate cyclase [Candidatus Omnitrophota bacterium]
MTSALLLCFNLIIILGAIYFGLSGTLIIGALSLLTVFWHSLKVTQFHFQALFLIATTVSMLYIYFSRLINRGKVINLELENLDEERNVLAVELEHLRIENSSFKEKLKRYATLKDLTETLSSTLDLERASSLVTTEALRIVGKADGCLLYLVDNEKQELKLVNTRAASGQQKGGNKKGDIFDQWAFKQHMPLLIRDVYKDFRFDAGSYLGPLHGARSLISAPLIRENKLLGILRLDSVSSDNFDANDLRLLSIISDLSAASIQNSLLYQNTEKLAITDGLTGMFVHRYFQKRFDEEIGRSLWTKSPFALLMLDIDNFKSYNDKYGHIAGDILLKQIARLISLSVNPGDIVARYGGEEFAVLIVDTPGPQAQKLAEWIREKIEKKPFLLRRETTNVSISGGLTFYPQHGKDKTTLIRTADQALYKAKSEGKNKICIP